MDQFMKMRKKMSMAESTRQVLNKSIDLLHKLSNKKIAKDAAKKEVSALLSHYFTSMGESSNGISKESKVKLELFLDQAYEILDKTDSGDTPLYEAIMMMNKVVVNNQVPEKVEETVVSEAPSIRVSESKSAPEQWDDEEDEEEEDDEEYQMKQNEDRPLRFEAKEMPKTSQPTRRVHFEKSSFQNRSQQKQKEVGNLVDEVLQQKFALENSIDQLNHSLRAMGFELRAIQPE